MESPILRRYTGIFFKTSILLQVDLGLRIFIRVQRNYYLSELNMIHPFREGNGRSLREYIRQLALEGGHIINWSLIDSEKLLEATIISVGKNYGPLGNCIFQVIENSKYSDVEFST